jgi:hypothetical protein
VSGREMYEPTAPVVLARHVSRCGLCDSRIVPDEQITERDGEWVHADCASEFDDDFGDAA